MSTKSNRILGLDLGIGSIGWAVIDLENQRIDDLGVRIFSSGEEGARKAADRASQQRRSKRSVRRQVRRCHQRKVELKNFLQEIGLISTEKINEAYRTPGFNPDVFTLRPKALFEKLHPIEIAAILINFANYRGYRDFYEDDEMMREGPVKKAMNAVQEIFEAPENIGKWDTVGQMIYEHPLFRNHLGKITFRNRNKPSEKEPAKKETNYKYLIPRRLLQDEANMILNKQSEYYEVLSSDQIDRIIHIVFRQRAFEDGPGPNKSLCPEKREAMLTASRGLQKYSGFDEMIGACPFYPEEKRGTKNSQLYDMYVLVNNLSQYSYQKENRTVSFPADLLDEMRNAIIEKKGEISVKEFKEFCKRNEITVIGGDANKKKLTASPFIKFLCDENLFSENERAAFSGEDYLDETSFSHRIGIVLTQYITPSKRKNALKELFETYGYSSTEFIDSIKNKKISGGAGVSDRYMKEAIRAFKDGQRYGEFQAEFLDKKPKSDFAWSKLSSKGSIRPIGDPDLVRNPVVYRSINEARKLINAIRKAYPGISQFNIELARDIGKSLETRKDIRSDQESRQKDNETLMNELMIKLGDAGFDVGLSDKLFMKYKLWKDQEQSCLYSGKEISFAMLISNSSQIDHVVPQSIVLDETIHNKVLVLSEENQRKGNRLPLEYMDVSQAESFKNRIAGFQRKEKISRKKMQYLLLEKLDDETVSGFVDRNINDARYISKYVANLLRTAFSSEKESVKVYVLNGAVTSRFRRYWLGGKFSNQKPSIYGLEEKGRDLHYYHHAIDAVVIANMTRANMEIAQDYIKIADMKREYQIFLKTDNAASAEKKNAEIKKEIQSSVDKLHKHYGYSTTYVEQLLDQGSVPSIIRNLREEVELRVPLKIEFDDKEYFRYIRASRDLEKLLSLAKDELSSTKEGECARLHTDLTAKINEIINEVDPGVTAITETGEIVYTEGENSRVTLKEYLRKRKPKELISFIHNITMFTEEEYAQRVSEYYADQEFASKIKLPYVSFKVDRKYRSNFTASENPVALTATGFSTYHELEKDIKENMKSPYYVRFNKGVGESGNFTIYEVRSYYCIEVYTDTEGSYGVRGIRYVDLYKKKGSLYLKKPLQEGYRHVIYIFQNEYIRAYNPKGKLKNNGFGSYRGVENINQCTGKIRLFSNGGLNGRDTYISFAGLVEKVEMSLLGHIMGTVKCGDQSLFMTERN